MNKKEGGALVGAPPRLLSAKTEKQDYDGNENDPKQNVFAEKIASTVHSGTPFFDTELVSVHCYCMKRKGMCESRFRRRF